MFLLRRRSGLGGELEFVKMPANPLGLRGVCGKERKGFRPFFVSGENLVLLFESFCARGDANEFLAVNECVTLLASESAERQGSAAVLAIASGFEDGGHGWPGEAGLGSERRRSGVRRERAEDINFRTSCETPGNFHAYKKNDEAN